MPLARLDHVNLRTANLAAMEAFYVEALGMTPGPRPPFAFSGTWLYCGGQATVHLVEVPVKPAPAQPTPAGELRLDIGRASCRGRVCQDDYIKVVADSFKKNNTR